MKALTGYARAWTCRRRRRSASGGIEGEGYGEEFAAFADELRACARGRLSSDGRGDRCDCRQRASIDTGAVARDRLRVDARKWVLAKMLPKEFGDKLELSGRPGQADQVDCGRLCQRSSAPAGVSRTGASSECRLPACSLRWRHRSIPGAKGGRASAKSHYFAEKLIRRCLAAPTRAVGVRETQTSIDQSVHQLLKDKIAHYKLEGEYFKVTDNYIEGRSGEPHHLQGDAEPTAVGIKSLEGADIAWVEEAQSLSKHSLTTLRPTIRKPFSQIWFSWNPNSPKDAVDNFLLVEKPTNSVVVHATYRTILGFLPRCSRRCAMTASEIRTDTRACVAGQIQGALRGPRVPQLAPGQSRRSSIRRERRSILDPISGSPKIQACSSGAISRAGRSMCSPRLTPSAAISITRHFCLPAQTMKALTS